MIRLTLADPMEIPEESTELDLSLAGDVTPASEGDAADFGDLDLAPTPDPIETDSAALDLSEPMADAGADGTAVEENDAASFDFGDMGGGLELEAAPDEPMDGEAMDLSGGGIGADLGGEDPTPDFSGGMELESETDFGGGALELETPMSEFSPADPPAWMEKDGPGGDAEEGVLDFSAAGAGADADAPGEVPLRERRTSVNKPSKPKHRRQRNLAGPIVGIVAILAFGMGGYVAWPLLSAQLFGPNEPEVPAVFIPTLAAELMPQMREAADAAFAATFEDVRREWNTQGPEQSPSSDWLAGVYLANASDFANVEAFWEGMDGFLEGVRGIDLAAFDAAYLGALEAQGVSAADGALMRERADSGFAAAAPVRAATFEKVDALVQGAVALHTFLVGNEANIEHVPASNITTDPVLEANPSTPEIREAMEDLIDVVTRALADLGYLDLVTAEGLWGTVLEQVQANGVR